MYLVFDFETTGIQGLDRDIPQRAIQLAWLLMDDNNNIVTVKSFYFSGQTELNTEFHNTLSIDFLNKVGYTAMEILTLFMKDVQVAVAHNGKLVAHNIEFDYKILRNELKRTFDSDFELEDHFLYCTMKKSTEYCKLPKAKQSNIHKKQSVGYKYPKLIELYRVLFNQDPPEKLHDALNDVMVTQRCFAAMKTLNL